MNEPMEFTRFRQAALDQGFDEVTAREWAPGQHLGLHGHPFAASALMVRGDMWLTVGEHTRHLRAGDRFELAPDEPHAERYGPEGATYWVARRHKPRTGTED